MKKKMIRSAADPPLWGLSEQTWTALFKAIKADIANASSQKDIFDIDEEGNMMPSDRTYSESMDIDDNGDLMPKGV